MDVDERLKQKLSSLFPYLNEKQRRIAAAVEARSLGHGGITRVASAAGLSRPVIRKGLDELKDRKRGLQPAREFQDQGRGRPLR